MPEQTSGDEVGNESKRDYRALAITYLRSFRVFGLPALEFADFYTNLSVTSSLYESGYTFWAVISTVFLVSSALVSSKIGNRPVRSDYDYKKHRNCYLYDATLQNMAKPKQKKLTHKQLEDKPQNRCFKCINHTFLCHEKKDRCFGKLKNFKGPQLPYFGLQDFAPGTQLSLTMGSLLGLVHLWPFYFLGLSMKIKESDKSENSDEETKSEKVDEGMVFDKETSARDMMEKWPKEKQQDYAINRFICLSLEACPQMFLQMYIWFNAVNSNVEMPSAVPVSVILSMVSMIWGLWEWWWFLFGGEYRQVNKRWATICFVLQIGTGLLAKVLMLMYFWASMQYSAYLLLLLMLPGRFILAVYWEQVSPFLVFIRLPFDFLLIKLFPVAMGATFLTFVEMIICLSSPEENEIDGGIIAAIVVICWLLEKAMLLFLAHEYHNNFPGGFKDHVINFFRCKRVKQEGEEIDYSTGIKQGKEDLWRRGTIEKLVERDVYKIRPKIAEKKVQRQSWCSDVGLIEEHKEELQNTGLVTKTDKEIKAIVTDVVEKKTRWLGLEQLWQRRADQEYEKDDGQEGKKNIQNEANAQTADSQQSSTSPEDVEVTVQPDDKPGDEEMGSTNNT